jgi:large subunit ribosomal protein L23
MAAKEKTKAKKEKQALAEWMFDIVRTPVVTEKSTLGSQHGQMTFMVPLCATKPDIKAAVETVFEVKVTGVNTMIAKGKTKRFRGAKGFRKDEKKAIVTLAEGETIDLGTGV